MTMSLPVRVVLASRETFNRGRFRLAVMGVLVVQGNDIWIFDDPAAVNEICSTPPGVPVGDQPPTDLVDARIRIVDQTFLSRLSADIPPLPSGDFAYFDTAMICGSTRLEGNEVVLDGIWGAILYRAGKKFWAIDRPPDDDPE